MISGLLARTGHDVDQVPDLESGLERLEKQAYDVIILLESPAIESWPICQSIREMTDAPLIVISMNASTETCVKAINAGADYCLRNPFGPLEFLARINSLLQRTTSRQIYSLFS
jgi:DNA-binding response OmpR family regulator